MHMNHIADDFVALVAAARVVIQSLFLHLKYIRKYTPKYTQKYTRNFSSGNLFET